MHTRLASSSSRVLVPAVFVLASAVSFSAEQRDNGASGYQETLLRIGAMQSVGSLERPYPSLGKSDAFLAAGYEENGKVYFRISPNVKRMVKVEKGIDRISFPANSWLRQRMVEAVVEHSGPVQKGDLIPLFGCLYSVHRITREEGGGTGREITLLKVDKKNYPSGMSLSEYGYAAVDGGGLDLPTGSPRADLLVRWDPKRRVFLLNLLKSYAVTNLPPRDRVFDITVGWREEQMTAKKDSLVVLKTPGKDVYLRIVNIVMPSKDDRIPGWVEVRQIWPKLTAYNSEDGVDSE
ncbi:MAG: hypothetical protein H8E37_04945 [Planctomycetes bacterium]|nr:hypothetical protein [Planctomycetota bacterium]